MRIKFLKRWRSFNANQLTDFAGGASEQLIKRGIAVAFPLPPGIEPPAVLDIDVDTKAPPKPERPEIEVIRDDQTKVPRQKRKTTKPKQ